MIFLLTLENENLNCLKKLSLPPLKSLNGITGKKLVRRSREPNQCLRVAMVGKYVGIGDFQLTDSHISVNQSLVHAWSGKDASVEITWIDGHEFENGDRELAELADFDGVIVPGAFGGGGSEGVINAISFARKNKIPYLGLCYGLQLLDLSSMPVM